MRYLLLNRLPIGTVPYEFHATILTACRKYYTMGNTPKIVSSTGQPSRSMVLNGGGRSQVIVGPGDKGPDEFVVDDRPRSTPSRPLQPFPFSASYSDVISIAAMDLISSVHKEWSEFADGAGRARMIARMLSKYWKVNQSLLLKDSHGRIAKHYYVIFDTISQYDEGSDIPVMVLARGIDESEILDFAPGLEKNALRIIQVFHALLRAFLYGEVPSDYHCIEDGWTDTTSDALCLGRETAMNAMVLIRNLDLPVNLYEYAEALAQRIEIRIEIKEAPIDLSFPSPTPLPAEEASPVDVRVPRKEISIEERRMAEFSFPSLDEVSFGTMGEMIYNSFFSQVLEDEELGFFLGFTQEENLGGKNLKKMHHRILFPDADDVLAKYSPRIRERILYLWAVEGVRRMDIDSSDQKLLGEDRIRALRLMRLLALMGWEIYYDKRNCYSTAFGGELGLLGRWMKKGYEPNDQEELNFAGIAGLDRGEVQRILEQNISVLAKR